MNFSVLLCIFAEYLILGTLHKNNLHNNKYDFAKLSKVHPQLESHITTNINGEPTINFFNPDSVKELNRALLMLHYNINYWDIPTGALCPPIPSRADYIHHLSDLIGKTNKQIRCLDIGIGASCIYPIIGVDSYNWEFVGSDIDLQSINNAKEIIERNPRLKAMVELRLQDDKTKIFNGIIKPTEHFNATICNPPFHSSAQNATKASLRKLRNLTGKNVKQVSLNFGGNANELWCDGGELKFVKSMIIESSQYKQNCDWFTTLVSNGDNLAPLYRCLESRNTKEVRTIDMQLGNKVSRILAWRY